MAPTFQSSSLLGVSRTVRRYALTESLSASSIADPDKQTGYRFFPGVETDTGTEPLQTYDIERSSISRKFLAYLSIENNRTYHPHFGFPNMFVPFVTTTVTRMRSMMALLHEAHRRPRIEDVFVQDVPKFHFVGKATGARWTHAVRGMAARRISDT